MLNRSGGVRGKRGTGGSAGQTPRRRSASAPKRRALQPSGAIAVVLIEDNRLLREGMANRLQAEPGFTLVAASADADEVIRLAHNASPDVIVIDLGLPDHDGLRLTETVRARVPGARVIVMGLVPVQEDVADYIRAGASGFVMKDVTFDEFFATIRAVAAGQTVLPTQLTNSLFAQIASDATHHEPTPYREAVRLTAREREVVHLIGEGLSNSAIGDRLQIAVHTVKSHVHNILEKLTLRSRLEVAAFSHGTRRIPPDEA
jgi:DNA-binding NarL/FixJ family response regulator